MPRPDFPKTLPEFVRRFPDDEACWDYLVQSRWPDGVVCEDGKPAWFEERRKLFECEDGHQWSVTSGTVIDEGTGEIVLLRRYHPNRYFISVFGVRGIKQRDWTVAEVTLPAPPQE